MIKIIETNILMKDNDIADHQARVIEVESWDTYVKMYENYNGEACGYFKTNYGNLIGNSLPKQAQIEKLKYTDFTLMCEMKLWDGMKTIKLAYKIDIGLKDGDINDHKNV